MAQEVTLADVDKLYVDRNYKYKVWGEEPDGDKAVNHLVAHEAFVKALVTWFEQMRLKAVAFGN